MTAAQPEALSVAAVDEQSVPIDTARWVALATAVLRDEGVTGPAELALWFVDDEEIAALNEQHLDEHGPTDVLSFPLDDGDVVPGVPALLGDVVICPEVALAQFADHAGTFDDEIALLIVHGILHVLGHDHAEPDEADVMRARELELLTALHWHGPAPAGFRQTHD